MMEFIATKKPSIPNNRDERPNGIPRYHQNSRQQKTPAHLKKELKQFLAPITGREHVTAYSISAAPLPGENSAEPDADAASSKEPRDSLRRFSVGIQRNPAYCACS
jgi:hypothetical protein